MPNGWHNTYKRVGGGIKWEYVINPISMEKTERAQSERARGDERETNNGCQTYRLANRDPEIAHMIGDTSRIHVNFGNSRGETYALS